MSFFAEMANTLGFTPPSVGYQIVDYNGEAVYVEGIKRILFLSDESIRLETKRAFITFSGENLLLERADEGSVVIRGKVKGIAVDER